MRSVEVVSPLGRCSAYIAYHKSHLCQNHKRKHYTFDTDLCQSYQGNIYD
uniref:Uncharacterized protein n=1 Tax=Anguilla anguilla TaxID=7936 RepID=A0A0E9S3Z5_ANGAN